MENKQFRLKRIRSQIRRFMPVLFLALSVFLMTLWQTKNETVVAVRGYVADKMVPVVSVLSAPARWLKKGKDAFSDAVFLYHRNQELEQENKVLRSWRALALQLQSEQNEIKQMLGYVPYKNSVSMVARLVMDTGDKFSRSYVVLAGKNSGLKEGAVALTDKGLFARVIDVGDYGSRLMLLTDYSSRVPVIVGKNRIPAILTGDNSNHPKIIFQDKNETISVGDVVLTSGYMGVYPSGLNIGIVRKVDEDDIEVDLFESGERLEFVRLVDFGLMDVLLKTNCEEP